MIEKELGDVDAKIIQDLLVDGRKTFTKIAEECGEKKSTISKRFKELENSGIINGSTIQLNYGALGYSAVGTLYFKIKSAHIEDAVERIRQIPDIYFASKQENDTAVHVVATLKTIDEFNRVKEMILRFPTVSELTTNVWMGIRNIPYNIKLIENYTSATNAIGTATIDPIEVDDVDKQIINSLSTNGRIPFTTIANKIDIATNTVIRRYERLKASGVINTSIQINPLKIGYRAVAIFNLAFVSQTNISSVVDKLSTIQNIYLIIKTSGQYDLSVFCMIKDIDQYLELQKNIAHADDISKSQITIKHPKAALPGIKEYISTF